MALNNAIELWSETPNQFCAYWLPAIVRIWPPLSPNCMLSCLSLKRFLLHRLPKRFLLHRLPKRLMMQWTSMAFQRMIYKMMMI